MNKPGGKWLPPSKSKINSEESAKVWIDLRWQESGKSEEDVHCEMYLG